MGSAARPVVGAGGQLDGRTGGLLKSSVLSPGLGLLDQAPDVTPERPPRPPLQ